MKSCRILISLPKNCSHKARNSLHRSGMCFFPWKDSNLVISCQEQWAAFLIRNPSGTVILSHSSLGYAERNTESVLHDWLKMNYLYLVRNLKSPYEMTATLNPSVQRVPEIGKSLLGLWDSRWDLTSKSKALLQLSKLSKKSKRSTHLKILREKFSVAKQI